VQRRSVTSGARVVIAMFGAVAALTVLVVAAFLLTDEPAVRCVEGELQDNAARPDGTVLPRVETFATLGEAESFICRRIPHPRSTGDLTLTQVRVARERNLGETIEGKGGASMELEYWLDDVSRLRLLVTFPPEGESGVEGPPPEEITIRGEPALLQGVDSGTYVLWAREGFSFFAAAAPGVERSALLQMLESVR
jgi:hypothetical protein